MKEFFIQLIFKLSISAIFRKLEKRIFSSGKYLIVVNLNIESIFANFAFVQRIRNIREEFAPVFLSFFCRFIRNTGTTIKGTGTAQFIMPTNESLKKYNLYYMKASFKVLCRVDKLTTFFF